jgi:hypothetical protein
MVNVAGRHLICAFCTFDGHSATLELGRNQLSGPIPSEIGSMQSLSKYNPIQRLRQHFLLAQTSSPSSQKITM